MRPRPISPGLYDLGSSGVENDAEEDVAKPLLHEASVGRLSRERDPHVVASRGDVQARVGEVANAEPRRHAPVGERVLKHRRDLSDGCVDDARVAFKRITEPVVVILK